MHLPCISQDEPGIKDAAKACELLHDLMVNALDQRKPGHAVLYRLNGAAAAEQPMILRRPLRRKGPDCWLAERSRSSNDVFQLVRGCFSPRSESKQSKRAACLAPGTHLLDRGLVEIYLSEATHNEMWRLRPTKPPQLAPSAATAGCSSLNSLR